MRLELERMQTTQPQTDPHAHTPSHAHTTGHIPTDTELGVCVCVCVCVCVFVCLCVCSCFVCVLIGVTNKPCSGSCLSCRTSLNSSSRDPRVGGNGTKGEGGGGVKETRRDREASGEART